MINMFPVLLGPYLLSPHPHLLLLWIVLVIMAAVHSHSDYNFPYMGNISFHDYHHYNFKGNYGVFRILDKLFKTDESYTSFIKNK